MVAAFPAAKLGALFIKQISKPIANFCKERAKNSPTFRKFVILPPAHFYNWCEVRMKMWVLNLGKPVNIPVLNEAMAIDLGATLLGEGILFAIAAAILINEYNRSSRKEERKEQQNLEEKEKLNNTIQELYLNSEKQATQIRELTRLIYDLEQRVIQKPWVSKSETLADGDHPPTSALPHRKTKSITSSGKRKRPPKFVKDQDGVNCIPNEEKSDVPAITVSNNILANAMDVVENDLFYTCDEEAQPSLLSLAINHIYKNVYKVPLTFI